MALWAPYSESALDLTKTAAVKSETVCSRAESPQHLYPRCPVSPARSSPPDHAGYYAAYYSRVQAVPSPQFSPDSASSWSSPNLYPSGISVLPLSPTKTADYEVDSLEDDMEYQSFERDALRAMAEKNGGSLLGNNPRMRRAVQASQAADDSYRQQRQRNNHAAKQSRDRRKLREVRLAFQVTFLKKKMADMRARLASRVCLSCQKHCVC